MWVKPFFPENIETLRFLTLRVVLRTFSVGFVFSGVVFCYCIDDVSSQPATNEANNLEQYKHPHVFMKIQCHPQLLLTLLKEGYTMCHWKELLWKEQKFMELNDAK